jgi:hypothetical protein
MKSVALVCLALSIIGSSLVLTASDANALVCASGPYRAGCVGGVGVRPYGGYGVRRGIYGGAAYRGGMYHRGFVGRGRRFR